jgi:hypothetical protein
LSREVIPESASRTMHFDRDLTPDQCDRRKSPADHINVEFLVGAPRLQVRAIRRREFQIERR